MRKSEKCVVCKSTHKIEQCQAFKTKSIRQRNIIARINKLCLNCLKSGHFVADCKSKIRCSSCQRRHHSLLHKDKKDLGSPEKETKAPTAQQLIAEKEESGDPSQPVKAVNVVGMKVIKAAKSEDKSTENRIKTSLQVVPVRVCDEHGRSVATYALLDTGSEESFLTRKLADRMKIDVKSFDTLTVCTLNGESTVNVGRTNVVVEPLKNPENRRVRIQDVKIVETLNIKPFKQVDISKWSHLEGIEIPEIAEGDVTILIGANVPEVLVHEESRIGKAGEPYAVHTMLGWAILGPVGSGSRKTNVNLIRSTDEGLDRQLQQLLTLDNIGMSDTGTKEMSKDDKVALEILDRTVRMVDGHYEVGMLWKNEDAWLPDNKLVAEARLRSLKRKLGKDKLLHDKYKSFINNHLEKGYARKLTPEEATQRSNKTWYLPHHAVFHPKKPEKIRVVFNAASMHEGISLNNQLYQGPDLANNLIGVLLRFREERIALVADIEAMFHQVKVSSEDADSLRFLWWEDGDLNEPPAEYQMTSHIFGAADSPSCANYCLKRTADDNKSSFTEESVITVKRDFYVDDLLKSVSSVAKAIRLANELIELLSNGGFRLTKWMSNSREVLSNISEEERAKPSLDLDLDQLPVERALGVKWDVERDHFQFQVHQLEKPCTKRGILSTFSSLYDPLGLVCPVVLEAKKIMQRLWKAKVDWDEPIPEEEKDRWEKWRLELSALSLIEVPRCYLSSTAEIVEITLHLFSDASEDGYGMCSYLRFLHADGTVKCSFLFGKSKTSPLRLTTIPRLELQAATLSVKMYIVIKHELTYQIAEAFFWTDSQTALQYIKNRTKRFHTYVANRVAQISEATSPDQWRHCPGKLNPADDASRGMNAQTLSTNHRWWNGPEFLWQEREYWPETKVSEVPDDDPETRKEVKIHQVNTTSPCREVIQRLINYHSDWLRLLRNVVWLVRFVDWIRSRRTTRNTEILSQEELNRANDLVVRAVQKESFGEELDLLTNGNEVKASSSLLRLKPMVEDGILRVGGRLAQAPSLTYEEKHPAILPKGHHLSVLILRHYHESAAHAGREQTLAQARQKFWIIAGRNLAKKAISNCFKCRRMNSRTMTQVMAPLPEVRLEPYNPPFTTAGVDFFGPLMVKQGRGTAKRWGCLITCMTTRAVYLDVAPSLQTDDFILLLRQFICRRGPPKEIRSDRGTNFVGANREMREAIKQLDQTQIQRQMQEREVKWIFHPPTAAHMSGVWERLVQTAKKHLKAIIGDRLLNEFALRTLLAEVEFIMNNRPIIPVSDDPSDLEALTPNHFLLQRRVHGLPPGAFVKEDYLCRKQWRKVQYLTELFWNRWSKEYLPNLQERQKWLRIRRNLRPGDLVIIKESGLPRNRWPLGRVTQVFSGRDERVRSAKVKTTGGEFHRPITKLCLLEGNI